MNDCDKIQRNISHPSTLHTAFVSYSSNNRKDPAKQTFPLYNKVAAIVANGSNYTTKCEKCIASTNVVHEAAVSLPVPDFTDLLIRICTSIPKEGMSQTLMYSKGNLTHPDIFAATCQSEYSGVGGIGPYFAQL